MKFRTTFILAAALLIAGTVIYLGVRNNGDNPSANSSANPNAPSSDTPGGRLLFRTAPADLDHLVIRNAAGETLELTRADQQWKLIRPIDWPANPDAVAQILNEITNLHSDARVTLDADNSAVAGLNPPPFTIEVSGPGGKFFSVQIGNHARLGADLYVKTSESNQADLVAAGALNQQLSAGWEPLVESLRDRGMVMMPPADIRQIEIVRPGSVLRLHRVGEGRLGSWEITHPATIPADRNEVAAMIQFLTGLKSAAFTTESAAQTAGGQFEQPRVSIRLSANAAPAQPSDAAATQPAGGDGTSIQIGQPVGSDTSKTWVKVIAGDGRVIVAKAMLTPEMVGRLMSVTGMDLRDRVVLNVDPEKVERFTVRIERPATTQPTTRPAWHREITIARAPASGAPSTMPASTQPVADNANAPESQWRFITGGQGEANDRTVYALLLSLHPLRVEKYVEPAKVAGTIFTLTVHTLPSQEYPHGEDQVLVFIEAKEGLIGTYRGLQFKMSPLMLEKLSDDFKVPATPGMPFPGMH